jgi:hypothetical protein
LFATWLRESLREPHRLHLVFDASTADEQDVGAGAGSRFIRTQVCRLLADDAIRELPKWEVGGDRRGHLAGWQLYRKAIPQLSNFEACHLCPQALTYRALRTRYAEQRR